MEGYEAMCNVVKNYFSEVFSGHMSENIDVHAVSPRTVSIYQNLKLGEEVTVRYI